MPDIQAGSTNCLLLQKWAKVLLLCFGDWPLSLLHSSKLQL